MSSLHPLIWRFVHPQISASHLLRVMTEKKETWPRGKRLMPSKMSVTPLGPLIGNKERGPNLLQAQKPETCTTRSSLFLLPLPTNATSEYWWSRVTCNSLMLSYSTDHLLFFFRFHEYGKSPSPSSSIGSSNSGSGRNSFEPRVPDVATVPDQECSKARTHDITPSSCGPQQLPGPQDYTGVLNMSMTQTSKPGVIGHHLYTPYSSEQPLGQWSGPGPAQYPPPHHLTADYTTQAVHHGYHHGNMAEWSQYSLFPYSCWWRARRRQNDWEWLLLMLPRHPARTRLAVKVHVQRRLSNKRRKQERCKEARSRLSRLEAFRLPLRRLYMCAMPCWLIVLLIAYLFCISSHCQV